MSSRAGLKAQTVKSAPSKRLGAQAANAGAAPTVRTTARRLAKTAKPRRVKIPNPSLKACLLRAKPPLKPPAAPKHTPDNGPEPSRVLAGSADMRWAGPALKGLRYSTGAPLSLRFDVWVPFAARRSEEHTSEL